MTNSTIYELSFEGKTEELMSLFEESDNTRILSRDGTTALVGAIEGRHLETLIRLLKAGVPVNNSLRNNFSPVMYAAYQNYPEAIYLLCEFGSDVNLQDSTGKTSLIYAAEQGHIQCVKALISCGANITISDRKGKTASYYAKKKHYGDIEDIINS